MQKEKIKTRSCLIEMYVVFIVTAVTEQMREINVKASVNCIGYL